MDVSALDNGDLIVIVNALDQNGKVVSVKTRRLTKESHSGLDSITIIDNQDTRVDVYNLQGIAIKRNVDRKDWERGLAAGIYIIGGKKVLIK